MSTISLLAIQIPGWVLLLYLIVAQCPPAISYELGVRMGTQEPAEIVTEVGTAIFWGFAFADLVFYVPLLGLGLIGQLLGADWSPLILGAALGITAYWPIVCLAMVKAARGAPGWNLPKEAQYWIVLPLIALWALTAIALIWVSL